MYRLVHHPDKEPVSGLGGCCFRALIPPRRSHSLGGTPHPVIVTGKDHKDYIGILLVL